jgi:hypothetical protein
MVELELNWANIGGEFAANVQMCNDANGRMGIRSHDTDESSRRVHLL